MNNNRSCKKELSGRILACVLCAVFVLMTLFAGMGVRLPKAYAQTSSKVLAGKYISVMGDSISTYMGYSDKYPIADESYTNRYGEPYYGPVGAECHCTDLLVSDTWWYQAAEELGAEILMSNAGNSTGLLHAYYPADEQWQQYLQDLLAYKSRPYYMGTAEHDPDIIALYIGSNDVAKVQQSGFGSIDDVNFDALITANEDNTYTYAEPSTVAEAYCILLHKITTTYPDAQVYCFAVLPNSGVAAPPSASGTLKTVNKRLQSVVPFNKMVRGVAAHFGAYVVELPDAFGIDPDGDGVAVQEDFEKFQACFWEGPHPNAAGFDIITDCFVKKVLENNKPLSVPENTVLVETRGGNYENVAVTSNTQNTDEGAVLTQNAAGYVTESGMTVDYDSRLLTKQNGDTDFEDNYTSDNADQTYHAYGGSTEQITKEAPDVSVDIPLVSTDDPSTTEDETTNAQTGTVIDPVPEGDTKTSDDDGIYDYSVRSTVNPGGIKVHTGSIDITELTVEGKSKDMTHVVNQTEPTQTNQMITTMTPVTLPQSKEEVPAITEGYDYVYIGSDKASNFYTAYLYTEANDNKYPNEEPVYSDDSISLYAQYSHKTLASSNYNLVVPRLYLEKDKTVEHIEGEPPFVTKWESIQQYTLSDENAKIVSVYCADQVTIPSNGFSYKMLNVEDESYYSKDEARMIRTVANNGYWGTKSGYGSLEALKDLARRSGRFSEDEVNAITDGIAMTATQFAIWTYSNKMDHIKYVNSYYTNNADGVYPGKAADKQYTDLIFKLYFFLTELEPEVIEETDIKTSNTIINETNFIKNVSIKVTGQPEDRPENADNIDTNDTYTVDLSITLAVKPDKQKDDLIMVVFDETDKSDICTVRIAGAPLEGETEVKLDSRNTFVINDLPLTEGSTNISFSMSGSQMLGKDAYLYVSENKDGEISQTMVGIAEGKRSVGIKQSLTFDLDVENDVISQKRLYRNERIPTPTMTPTPTPSITPTPTPGITPTPTPGITPTPTPGITPTPTPGITPTPTPGITPTPTPYITPTPTPPTIILTPPPTLPIIIITPPPTPPSDLPKTSDANEPVLWMITAAAGLAVCLTAIFWRNKRKK